MGKQPSELFSESQRLLNAAESLEGGHKKDNVTKAKETTQRVLADMKKKQAVS